VKSIPQYVQYMNYQLYNTQLFRSTHSENPIIDYLKYIILKDFFRFKLDVDKIWLTVAVVSGYRCYYIYILKLFIYTITTASVNNIP